MQISGCLKRIEQKKTRASPFQGIFDRYDTRGYHADLMHVPTNVRRR